MMFASLSTLTFIVETTRNSNLNHQAQKRLEHWSAIWESWIFFEPLAFAPYIIQRKWLNLFFAKCVYYFFAPNWELRRSFFLLKMCSNTVRVRIRGATTNKILLWKFQKVWNKWGIILYWRVTNGQKSQQSHSWNTAHPMLCWMQLYCRKERLTQ